MGIGTGQENKLRYWPTTCNLISLIRLFSVLTILGFGWLGSPDTASATVQSAEDFLAPVTMSTASQQTLPAVCYAPGTSQDYVNQVAAFANSIVENSLSGIDPTDARFRVGDRWMATATNGAGLQRGDPTTLTWSYVPDGTMLGQTCGVPGELAGETSDFRATFNTNFGSFATWHALFVAIFDRWSAVSGITFVYEPNDDGVPFAAFPHNAGVAGVRGDIRIGGHRIDGPGANVLACNYFPDNGDMIIDTAHTGFYVPGNELAVRNTLAHEIGHGLAFNHVCPVEQTKLMEPFVSTMFDGPQFDDILAVHRLYGDKNEHNDTSGTATNHGLVPLNTPRTETEVSTDGSNDVNFYRFDAPAGAMATINLAPTTQVPYLEGPQNMDGSCPAGTSFDPRNIQNLGVELLGPDGTTVLATANANPAGGSETIMDVALPNGAGPYFLRVFGDAVDNVQAYTVTTTLTAVIAAIPTLPQWAFILMTLSLLTLATWHLTGQPNLLYSAVNGGGLAVANVSQLAMPVLIGQGLAGAGLASYGLFVSALLPHDFIGGSLAGILLGIMVACYQRGRMQ